ncbi:MAG: hypothetical protein NTW96_17700 [Planctomycetia bacterium]|nr:hypothetical protein [Planctomycetia bacterium]
MRRTVAEEEGSDALVDGDDRRVRGSLAGERDTWAGDVDTRLDDRVYEPLGDRVIERLGETSRDSTRLEVDIGLRVMLLDPLL